MFVALIRECFYRLLDKNSGDIGGELQEIEIFELKMQILQLSKERLDQYFLTFGVFYTLPLFIVSLIKFIRELNFCLISLLRGDCRCIKSKKCTYSVKPD